MQIGCCSRLLNPSHLSFGSFKTSSRDSRRLLSMIGEDYLDQHLSGGNRGDNCSDVCSCRYTAVMCHCYGIIEEEEKQRPLSYSFVNNIDISFQLKCCDEFDDIDGFAWVKKSCLRLQNNPFYHHVYVAGHSLVVAFQTVDQTICEVIHYLSVMSPNSLQE